MEQTIKQIILNTIEQQIDSQTGKGVNTYGVTLDQQIDKYDWNVMVNEELIDALQYQIKENKRLSFELKIKENALRSAKKELIQLNTLLLEEK